MAARHVIIIGPPGSGKGTQAMRVANELDLKHLSTGDLLREAVSEGTELGKKAEEYMKAGLLVPDEIMLGLIREQLDVLAGGGWMLDGFPRTLPQAEALTELLAGKGLAVDMVLLIDVDSDEIVGRLTSRRVCGDCKAVYNLSMLADGDESACEKCGGKLVTRPDDREETVKRRLKVYEEQTAPVLDFYRKAPGITAVAGSGDINEITAEIFRLMR